jgi:Recombinase
MLINLGYRELFGTLRRARRPSGSHKRFAASKRKGIWVGGPVPLGYVAVAKKVVVVPVEAETVRAIFARYLELASVQALAQDLDRNGIRSKPRKLADGRLMGGGPFGVSGLAHLLGRAPSAVWNAMSTRWCARWSRLPLRNIETIRIRPNSAHVRS